MAYKCFNCGKKSVMGTQHRHRPGVAGRQHLRKAPKTPKLFMPNLHSAYVLTGSFYKKVKLCTTCRRMLKKQGKIKVWKKEEKIPEQKIIKQTIKTTKEKPPVKAGKKAEKKIEEKPLKKTRKPKTTKIPTVSVEELVGKK